MQAQAGSDTTSSIPTIPSQGLLIGAMAAGIILLACGLFLGGYTLYVEVLHPHYYWTNHFKDYAPLTRVKVHRGMEWYYWMPQIAIGSLLTLINIGAYLEYYRDVPVGKIVKQYETTSLFGGRYYYFVIEGKNKAGQIRQQSHEVGQKTFFMNDVGDKISFK